MHETASTRLVHATYDETTITVYQAYGPEIAAPALQHQTFVPPFKRDRMTWIKPSFLWMMYRSGWATKPGQERVLGIEMTRAGFEAALAQASLSRYDRSVHADAAEWKAQKKSSPVRVQWDPDRSVSLERESYRAVQIGLSGVAVDQYLDEWIVSISDVTDLAHAVHAHVVAGRPEEARSLPPHETPYPLPPAIRARIGADPA